jgi:hypothetical protein
VVRVDARKTPPLAPAIAATAATSRSIAVRIVPGAAASSARPQRRDHVLRLQSSIVK